MAANDNHHFVPQFYLKNFSNNEDRATIQLYNHAISKFVPIATIKGQARKKYFYGRDGDVEKELSKFESAIALLFHDPITKIIPPTEPETFSLLREFITIQLFRTKKAANHLMKELNFAIEKIAPSLNISLPPGGKLVNDHAALFTLRNSIEHLQLMRHLSIKSIVNLTEFPFITSDAPVALYNQWMEKYGFYMGATALAVKGLQIFLPIHSRLMYCLYDPYVYNWGSDDNIIIKVEKENDIHQLNALEYLFSESHLYSSNEASREYLEAIIKENKKFRRDERSDSRIQQSISSNPKFHYFVSFTDPHFNLNLSFFALKEGAGSLDDQDGLPVLRHHSFNKLFTEIRKRE